MNGLITKSLEDGNIVHLLSFPTELMTPGERQVVEWIRLYAAKHGALPTLHRLGEQFETFMPIPMVDPLGDVYEKELAKKRNLFTRESLLSIQDKLRAGEDPLPHIEKIFNTIRGGGGDVVLYSRYDRSEYTRRITAYPYGIQALDKHTGGAAKGDLIYTIGRLGTGKTSFVLWLVKRWLLAGHRILLASNENRPVDVIGKIDSFIGGWNPLKKRTYDWTDDDLERIRTVSHIAATLDGELIIPSKPVANVSVLESLIYQYSPDIVVVDGVYLMGGGGRGEAMWERVTGISRELKQLAMTAQLPIIGVHQASRAAIGKRVDVENASYSDAIGQDADLVLGMNQEDDGSSYVEAVKNRWGSEFGFYMKLFFEDMSVRILDGRSLVEEGDV